MSAVDLTFQNTTSQPVNIYWIDFSGKERLYRTLRPGASYKQGTYVGHSWVMRDERSKDVLKQWKAKRGDQIVQIGNASAKEIKSRVYWHNNRGPNDGVQKSPEFSSLQEAEEFYTKLGLGYAKIIVSDNKLVKKYGGATWVNKCKKIAERNSDLGDNDTIILLPDNPDEKPDQQYDDRDTSNNPNNNNWDYQLIEINGVKIHYTQEAMDNHGEEMTNFLTESLTEIERLVPSDAWNVMKTTDIYVNDKYVMDGKRKTGACLHWSAGWLTGNGDLAEKEGHMEIYNIGDLINWTDQQPAVILHEMAHGYHWRRDHHQVAGKGPLSPILQETYEKAISDGKYDSVKHWVGSTTKHYATTNKAEYFAETVEAFFSSDKFRNDMYPFYRNELEEFDKDGFDMVSKIFEIDTDSTQKDDKDPSFEDFCRSQIATQPRLNMSMCKLFANLAVKYYESQDRFPTQSFIQP